MNRFLLSLLVPLVLTTLPSNAVAQPTNDNLPPPVLSPIVGGVPESGWPGVGALTTEVVGYGYMGSFCSGTLIAPQWVLTAAHCLKGSAEMPTTPELVQFYAGPDANMAGFGKKPDGDFAQGDAFFIHPEYDNVYSYNDVALMHLSAPVEGVEPLPYRTEDFPPSMQGESILYVGYGVSDGVEQTGGGVKRSGTMELSEWDNWIYVSNYAESGVCFGDSGGPGLYEDEQGWKVIGVNSAVWSENSSDPCSGSAVHTKVDAFKDWISGHVDGVQPSCLEDDELCWCKAGCQEDGSCDNSLCSVQSCMTVRNCIDACDGENRCRARCYRTGTKEALSILQDVVFCYYMQCNDSGGTFEECAREKCGYALGKCIPLETGNQTCKTVLSCLKGCPEGDAQCVLDCYNDGTEEAKQQAEQLIECYQQHCDEFPNPTHRWSCGWEACATEIETCMPPAECDIRGGDCGPNRACYPNPLGKFDCFPTLDLPVDEACDSLEMDEIQCADGLLCSAMAGPGSGQEFCFTADDCSKGGECLAPVWSGFDVLGVCTCSDQDEDGFCAGKDCNDNNDAQNPGVDEVCGNQRDDNCDGAIDEGCDAPVEETDVVDSDSVFGSLGGFGAKSHSGSGCSTAPSPIHPLSLFLLLGALICFIALRRKEANPS